MFLGFIDSFKNSTTENINMHIHKMLTQFWTSFKQTNAFKVHPEH